MTNKERLALSYFWWTWDDPVVRRAMEIAHLDHWIAVVETAFAENRRQNCKPTDWDELQCMHRERQNVRRVASGQSSSTKQFLLGIASVLNCGVQTLFPATDIWIAQTAQSLCCLQRVDAGADGRLTRRGAVDPALKKSGGIALDDALAYSRFMLENPPLAIGDAAIEARLSRLARREREVVCRVANQLGISLKRLDPLMPSANGGKTHGQVRNAGLASVRDE